MSKKFFMGHFKKIEDQRQPWKVKHNIYDILFLSVSAVIGGAEGWEDINDFGELRLDWLKQYGEFENGIPSAATIARVISRINPKHLQECFIGWMQECQELTKGSVVAIDGKTVRRSYNRRKGKSAIHMVSAFSVGNQQVLGQVKTAEKSNEITAIPELLELLMVQGCLVTIDAMGCQTKIAHKIISKGADYLLAVKGNQGRLHKALLEHFSLEYLHELKPSEGDIFNAKEFSHGRNELRLHTVSKLPEALHDFTYEWPELKTIGVAITQTKRPGEQYTEMQFRFYISSKDLTAKEFAEAIRTHWDIENKLHWVLDVGMREDDCKINMGEAAENFAGIRHIAVNLIKRETITKGGVRRKQKRAALSEDYMSQVLDG